MVRLSRNHFLLIFAITLFVAGLCVYFLTTAKPVSSPNTSSSALLFTNSSHHPDRPKQEPTSQATHKTSLVDMAIQNDESNEYALDELYEMGPGVAMLDRRRPTQKPIKSNRPLTGNNRKLATKLLQGLDEYMKSIKTLKMDFTLTDSTQAISDMTGQIVSMRPGQFTFDGTIKGNTVTCRMYFDKGTGFMEVGDRQMADDRPGNHPVKRPHTRH